MNSGKKALISVIVPIYNVEAYLCCCIESIIRQTYTCLEIILVNDGSPDGCGAICDEYAKKDNRIVVINKENGGVSSARNAGLNIARGEYITHIDGDDFIAPDMIEYLFNLLTQHEADISQCSYTVFSESSDAKSEKRASRLRERMKKILQWTSSEDEVVVLSGVSAMETIFTSEKPVFVTPHAKLYKAKLFSDTGIRYPTNWIHEGITYRVRHEDNYTTYKICCAADKVVCGGKRVYNYRVHVDGTMGLGESRKFNPHSLELVYSAREAVDFVRDNNIPLEKQAECMYISKCLIRMSEIIRKKEMRKWKNTFRSLRSSVFSVDRNKRFRRIGLLSYVVYILSV